MTSWVNWFKVTVIVTDIEEPGKVTWTVDPDGTETGTEGPQTLRQFQAGADLVATVTDLDNDDPGAVITTATWKWYRSASQSGPWAEIFEQTPNATYTASDEAESNDVGMYLRAVATYTDRRGGSKLAEFVSLYPVQEAREINTEPEFPSLVATRSVNEGSNKANVGAPVTGTDADGDVLNYIEVVGGDAGSFSIDGATGQIKTAVALDYENPIDNAFTDPDDAATNNTYVYTVMAVDSSGEDSLTNITVLITVNNVNEDPDFDTGTPGGMVDDHLEDLDELRIGALDADALEDGTGTFTADDPEGGEVTLSLLGDDSDLFEFIELATPATNSKMVAFKEKPDFENPADSNTDNIYEVTVRASDSVNTKDRSVTVKVTDADEDGEVELSTQNAVVGTEITATLTDSDGEIARIMWAWQSVDPGTTVCADLAADAAGWEDIKGAASATYTPASGDTGDCLRAMAWYMDRTTTEVDVVIPSDDGDPGDDVDNPVRFINTAVSVATTAVRDDPANQTPEFVDGTTTVRYVNENNDVANPTSIGDPVVATDDDGDTPVYTLGGADMGSFELNVGTGQLMTKAPLDHETDNSYTVTVTADDSSGESNSSARITVTIRVVDLDERPVIVNVAKPNIDHEDTFDHAENDTSLVATFTATDPEGVTPIVWSLLNTVTAPPQDVNGESTNNVEAGDIADNALFKISEINGQGVLEFKEAPDYEGASALGDDNYKVVVQASDGGDTELLDWYKVTVTVTNIEEPGKVTWEVDPDGDGGTLAANVPQPLLQFRAGAILTATVEDPDRATATSPDDTITADSWKWYRSLSDNGPCGSGPWEEIAQATSASYTVSDAATGDDRNNFLCVVASYTDALGSTEAEFVSHNKVKGIITSENTAPVLTSGAVATRKVNEGLAKANAGGPVTGTDADGDVLTYQLGGPDAPDTSPRFSIDPATGQIKTVGKLDFESPTDEYADGQADPAITARDNNYGVTVIAYDASGAASTQVTVVITVINVNDPPTFSSGPMGMADDHLEDLDELRIGTLDANDALEDGTFTASDPEGAQITLSLSGDDSDKFEFIELDTPLRNSKMVAFKEKPDFEKPGDRNRDNIYEVTVQASAAGQTTSRSVTVKVTDADEEGKVTLSPQDAVVGSELTATLADSDSNVDLSARGDVERVRWLWQLADAVPVDNELTCAGATFEDVPQAQDAFEDSATYTPKAGDTGKCLRAAVWYMDRTSTEDDATDDMDPGDADNPVRFINTAVSMSTTAVRDDPANQAPEFNDGTTTVRYVNENNDFGMPENIGDPVEATDADDDTISYELSGTDERSFDIDEGTGQLMTKARLDHETKPSYTVVVTAQDNSGAANASANITVTIKVMDLDEQPVISRAPASGLTISGPPVMSYEENGRGSVATYTAAGATSWSLSGVDAGLFTIVGGVLRFKSSPDYENAADVGGDNIYQVTVKASDGTYSDTQTVTVSVTDMDDVDAPPVVSDPVARYDDNDNGRIDKDELANGVFDYEIGGTISKDDLADLIFSYEIGG